MGSIKDKIEEYSEYSSGESEDEHDSVEESREVPKNHPTLGEQADRPSMDAFGTYAVCSPRETPRHKSHFSFGSSPRLKRCGGSFRLEKDENIEPIPEAEEPALESKPEADGLVK